MKGLDKTKVERFGTHGEERERERRENKRRLKNMKAKADAKHSCTPYKCPSSQSVITNRIQNQTLAYISKL